ncbi:hypothetical protein DFH06DRAFT_749515 [Mycena polygramma]|nr:hypothetical protein DFH06DRAFT_749515 [Mycena polygramma]
MSRNSAARDALERATLPSPSPAPALSTPHYCYYLHTTSDCQVAHPAYVIAPSPSVPVCPRGSALCLPTAPGWYWAPAEISTSKGNHVTIPLFSPASLPVFSMVSGLSNGVKVAYGTRRLGKGKTKTKTVPLNRTGKQMRAERDALHAQLASLSYTQRQELIDVDMADTSYYPETVGGDDDDGWDDLDKAPCLPHPVDAQLPLRLLGTSLSVPPAFAGYAGSFLCCSLRCSAVVAGLRHR